MEDVDRFMEEQAFNRALESIWDLIRAANKYVDTKAPWSLAKEKKINELHNVLYNLLETMRIVGVLIYPFMPEKSLSLLEQLGMKNAPQKEDFVWGKLPPGTKVKKGKPLFPKVDEAKIAQDVEKEILEAKSSEELIDIEDFSKIKIIVVKIISAERVPKTDKLLKLNLDTGKGIKTVVAGIGSKYTPQELIGKKILYLSNLKPRKLRGILSEGMILAADDGKDLYLPILPEETPVGAVLK